MPPSRLRRALVTCALGLVLLASAFASNHAAGSTGARTLNPADAFKLVAVGPGYVESSARQVVRTAADRVYIFAADDTAERQGTGPGVVRVWKANVAGIPTGFSEVDPANRPTASGDSANVIVSVDVRLDRNGIAHVIYVDETNGTLYYRTFSTATDTWGAASVIATGVKASFFTIKRSRNPAALTLDANDKPQVVYVSGSDLVYVNRVSGSWSAPVTISSGSFPIHPQIAFDGTGNLHVTWLDDIQNPPTSVIRYVQRTAAGTWLPREVVDSADVQDNATGDQSPSLAVTASGKPYVLWITQRGTSWIRIKYRSGSSWVSDNPAQNIYSHAPAIYAQNNDIYAFPGHDDQIRFGYDYHLSGQAWALYTPLTSQTDGTLDGSASIRWDPPRDNNPGVIDAAFFDENKFDDATYIPQLYYMAVLPAGSGAPDTTPPTASITSPAGGATVSGTTSVSATAADNIGVAGVQFKLDGAALGAEETSAPYSVGWDTTAASNGSHTLTALARDAAGNQTTSVAVTVTVANALPPPPPPPPPPPSGLVAAWGFNEGSGSTTADASGKGHTGTLSNATWTAGGKFGAALSFDGSSSWVTVADAPDLDLSDGMTLEAWVRPSALGTSWRTVLFKERSGGVVYSLYANQYSGLPVGQVYIGGEQNATGTAQLPLDTWTHVAVTFDGTSLRLYVDGTLTNTTAISGAMSGSDGPLRIGGNAIWNEWFDGLIDELRIYDRALSPTEIQTDMQTPVADTSPPSVPGGLIAATSGSTVNLSWTASSDNVGVSRYHLYRSPSAGFTPSPANRIAQPTGTNYTDPSLAAGSYYYRVAAEDAAGNLSAPSNEANATVSAQAPGGLVAAYGFGEGSGGVVADSSGNGNTGTIAGASWTSAGRYGSALSFNGVDNWVTIPDSSSLHLAGALTMEAWVKPSTLTGSWRTVLLKERPGDLCYALYANADTQGPSAHVFINGAEASARSTSTLPTNTWTYLAASYDGTTIRLYVDGTLTLSQTASGPISTSNDPLRIGGNAIWGEWFNGLIDEVRLYNGALNQTEIQTDMQTPVG